MSPPLIYAELLPHIRQISVLAALPTPSDDTTHVSLSPYRNILTLTHNGIAASLHLPGDIAPSYTPAAPHTGLAQLSWRIPLSPPSASSPRGTPTLPAPWSASALDSGTSFACRRCGQIILPAGRVTTWRDLPSENWAEMMEFWHCHKPDVPPVAGTEGGGDNTLKGYGANAQLVAQRGIGKVDLISFLLDSEDCSGLEIHHPSPTLTCTSCSTPLGTSTPSGYKLHKWTLTLTTTSLTTTTPSPPLQHFLLPHLHAQSSALGLAKFTIRSTPPDAPDADSSADTTTNDATNDATNNVARREGIYIWLFAPTLTISLSSSSSPSSTPIPPPPPLQASKLLYRPFPILPSSSSSSSQTQTPHPPSLSADKRTDTNTDTDTDTNAKIQQKRRQEQEEEAEILLPPSAVHDLITALQESNTSLPPSARRFTGGGGGGWEVGVLSRWG